MSDKIPAILQREPAVPPTGRTLRDRVRSDIEQGGVAECHGVDRETVLRMLGDGLAAELACVQHCRRRHYAYMMMATTGRTSSAAAECLEHGTEEHLHAERIAERIRQLGGEPDQEPDIFDRRGYGKCLESQDQMEMIREDLAIERNVIDGYEEMLRYLGEEDPLTRGMLIDILADEERHAEALTRLLRNTAP